MEFSTTAPFPPSSVRWTSHEEFNTTAPFPPSSGQMDLSRGVQHYGSFPPIIWSDGPLTWSSALRLMFPHHLVRWTSHEEFSTTAPFPPSSVRWTSHEEFSTTAPFPPSSVRWTSHEEFSTTASLPPSSVRWTSHEAFSTTAPFPPSSGQMDLSRGVQHHGFFAPIIESDGPLTRRSAPRLLCPHHLVRWTSHEEFSTTAPFPPIISQMDLSRGVQHYGSFPPIISQMDLSRGAQHHGSFPPIIWSDGPLTRRSALRLLSPHHLVRWTCHEEISTTAYFPPSSVRWTSHEELSTTAPFPTSSSQMNLSRGVQHYGSFPPPPISQMNLSRGVQHYGSFPHII